MITLDCSKCGAPLEADESASFVTCKFCHSQTIVPNHNARSAPSAPAFELPDTGHSRAARRILVPYIGMLALLMGGAITYASVRSGSSANAVASRGVVYKSCFVDANGDDALDIAMARTLGDGTWYAELIDGANGESRWHSERLGELAGVVCVDHHFLVLANDFKTYLHDARAPQTPAVVQGRDVTRYVTPGEGCVSLRTLEGSTINVGMDGRALDTCAPLRAEIDVVTGNAGVLGITESDFTLPTGEQLLARRTGTNVLSLRLSAGDTPTELQLMKCDLTGAIAVNADTVFLQACAIGNGDDGMVVALRKSDLSERWRKPIPGMSADHVGFFAWNGRVLVVQSFGKLFAFDANGNSVWRMN